MSRLGNIAQRIASLLYPDRCSVCGDVVENGMAVCEKCGDEIYPITGDTCRSCGVALSQHDESKCKALSAPITAAYYYRGKVRNIIIDFKEHKKLKYFNVFSSAFFDRIVSAYSNIDFDIVVCVPLSGERKSASSVMSEETAKRLLLDFDKDILEKYRETEKQHRLSGQRRCTNLENSIRVKSGKESAVAGKNVLLCDDVKTTGATLDECAKALYKAGAKKVCCACIAVSDYTVKK